MKYEVHVSGKDALGSNIIEEVLALGALGAKQKEGQLNLLKFPFRMVFEVEAEEPPMPSAQRRVFDAKKKEVFATVLQAQAKKEEKKVENKEVANFSVEQEVEEPEVDLSTNDAGEPWTKEQLEDLDWDTFKAVVATKDVRGRARDKMTKQYLEAVKEPESQES